MIQQPFHAGDFVWCRFPEQEKPAKPSRRPHIVYVLIVSGAISSSTLVVPRSSDDAYMAVVAYTTSRPWQAEGHRPGIMAFNAEQAALLGQLRPFWLHLWRLAHLPVTPAWFPRLAAAEGIVTGSAPLALRRELEAKAANVFRRHGDQAVQLGPLAPKPKQYR